MVIAGYSPSSSTHGMMFARHGSECSFFVLVKLREENEALKKLKAKIEGRNS